MCVCVALVSAVYVVVAVDLSCSHPRQMDKYAPFGEHHTCDRYTLVSLTLVVVFALHRSCHDRDRRRVA